MEAHPPDGPRASSRGVADHWQWRPDWTPQRRSWWWYATFACDPAVRRSAAAARRKLAREAPVDVIPPRWLHLSLVELGYEADVPRPTVYEHARTAQERVRHLDPVELHLGPAVVSDGAVVLPARSNGLDLVHGSLLDAVPTTLALPEQRPFEPHVSIAYVHRACHDRDLLQPPDPDHRVPQARSSTRLQRVSLVEVTRGGGHYRWTPRCVVRWGSDRPAAPARTTH